MIDQDTVFPSVDPMVQEAAEPAAQPIESSRADVRQISENLERLAFEPGNIPHKTEVALLQLVETTGAKFCCYHCTSTTGHCRDRIEPNADSGVGEVANTILSSHPAYEEMPALDQLAAMAADERQVKTARLQNGDIAISVPNRLREVLSVVVSNTDERHAYHLQMTQVFAVLLSQMRTASNAEKKAKSIATQPSFATSDLNDYGRRVASYLKGEWNAEHVALVVTQPGRRTKLLGVAPDRTRDAKSKFVQAIETVAREVVAEGPRTYAALDGSRSEAAAELLKMFSSEQGYAVPIRTDDDNLVAVAVALSNAVPTLESCGQLSDLADQLQLRVRADGSIADYLRPRLHAALTKQRTRWVFGSIGVIACILLMPTSLMVGAKCIVEPESKRYIAAPFEGILHQALHRPGDLVHAGEVIARIDPRDIELEISTIDNALGKARKERDRALIDGETANAQLAKFEMNRLQLRREMLERHRNELEIKSPTTGIVLSGDLKKLEGARLRTGQSLAEIGPVDDMVIEASVAADDIAHVSVGQTVRVKLDALPGKTFRGELKRIRPRSEQRDQKNVFVAEIAIDQNQAIDLRPGMTGRAKIVADKHPLGWNLFHKAWERSLYAIGW